MKSIVKQKSLETLLEEFFHVAHYNELGSKARWKHGDKKIYTVEELNSQFPDKAQIMELTKDYECESLKSSQYDPIRLKVLIGDEIEDRIPCYGIWIKVGNYKIKKTSCSSDPIIGARTKLYIKPLTQMPLPLWRKILKIMNLSWSIIRLIR